MNFTIIGKPMFYRPAVGGGMYPCRISSRSRGEEIAEYMGAQYCERFEHCKYENRIFLKPRSLKRVRDGDYVDVLDNHRYIEPFKKRSKIKLLSMSQIHHNYLTKELENEVHLIYHPHINYDNKTRVKNKTLVGGMIGKGVNHTYRVFDRIKEDLAKVGIDLINAFEFKTESTKQDMLDFYQKIDFMVIRYSNRRFTHSVYIHPGKIINAASFGIPTISEHLDGYMEFEGDYLEANTYDDVVKQAVKLKDDSFYNDMSHRLLERAKEYHISKIAKEYKKLWK